jgi:hypothetical protein
MEVTDEEVKDETPPNLPELPTLPKIQEEDKKRKVKVPLTAEQKKRRNKKTTEKQKQKRLQKKLERLNVGNQPLQNSGSSTPAPISTLSFSSHKRQENPKAPLEATPKGIQGDSGRTKRQLSMPTSEEVQNPGQPPKRAKNYAEAAQKALFLHFSLNGQEEDELNEEAFITLKRTLKQNISECTETRIQIKRMFLVAGKCAIECADEGTLLWTRTTLNAMENGIYKTTDASAPPTDKVEMVCWTEEKITEEDFGIFLNNLLKQNKGTLDPTSWRWDFCVRKEGQSLWTLGF